MSRPQTKEALTRMAWVAALRRSGHRQCCQRLTDGRGNVCALGLLQEILGGEREGYRALGHAAGLDFGQGLAVIRMNDFGDTFPQIADEIESWFSPP